MVLEKWKMVMVAPHTHFVMAGFCTLCDQCFTHVIGTWHFMVFCICMVCILSSQCFIFWNGFWWYTIFIKMDSLHVEQLMFHPLNWEWVLYNCSLEGCLYV
jgi:hypothetical protein